MKCVSDLALGGVCGIDSSNQNLDQLNWPEWWIIFYKKRHHPVLTYGKINHTSVRWEKDDKRAVFRDGELRMNQQYDVGASNNNGMGCVLCLHNEKLDSPAQFQDDEAISGVFLFSLLLSPPKWPNREKLWNHTVRRVVKWTGDSGSFWIFVLTVSSR